MDKRQFLRKMMEFSEPKFIYLLGYLWADGHIREDNKSYHVSLVLQNEDAEAIQNIFEGLDFVNLKTSHKRKDRKPVGSYLIHCKHFYEWLKSYDYGKKSWLSADKILSKIPENLQHYWFRGLVDGDGSIRANKLTLKRGDGGDFMTFSIRIYSGIEQDWAYLKKVCDKNFIRYNISTRERLVDGKINKSSEFSIGNRKDVIYFCDYLYKDFNIDKIGLKRKYNKVAAIKKYDKEVGNNLY